CVWNDQRNQFEHVQTIWTKSEATPQRPPMPSGHPAIIDGDDGRKLVLFGDPLPTLRCPATFEAWQDPSAWEPLTPQQSVLSADDGTEIKPHSGSIAWNPFRQ